MAATGHYVLLLSFRPFFATWSLRSLGWLSPDFATWLMVTQIYKIRSGFLVCLGLVTWKQKKHWKIKIGTNDLRRVTKWSAKGQVKNHTKLASCLITGGRSNAEWLMRWLQTTRMPLLGLIYCQRLNVTCSAIGQTAAYHVGTWRRHVFLWTVEF